jgi:periplasmic divalent cation tolerance protein
VADCFQVTTTLPDRAAAEQVAARLVEERLAACAQVLGPVSSTYVWKGEIEQAAEWYCNLKTTKTRLPELKARIRELHPYQVPEIIAIQILDGNADYLKWIEEVVSGGGSEAGSAS